MPTPRTQTRPNPLQQDLAGVPLVKTPRGAPNLVTTHDAPGGDVEEHSYNPPKSAAVRPCDEPEQCPNEALDKGSPNDEEEPSNNEDSADAEESD
ncbi:hypothetical protein E4U36_000210, partial [Claviceps purpurea]